MNFSKGIKICACSIANGSLPFGFIPFLYSCLLPPYLISGVCNYRMNCGDYSLNCGDYSLSYGNYRLNHGNYRLSHGNYRMSHGNYRLNHGNYSLSRAPPSENA